MKKGLFFYMGLIGIMLSFTVGMRVRAAETDIGETVQEDYYEQFFDYADIQELESELSGINKKYGKEDGISFQEISAKLLEGDVEGAIAMAVEGFYQGICGEIMGNRDLLVKLIALVIIAAIFNNYSSVLKFSYVGEQGFYITYLMIAVVLMQSFSIVYEIAAQTVSYLSDMMKCMLPAFYMSVILCGGLGTSQMVNTMFLWMLSLVEKLLLCIVLPAVRIYFLIVVLNQINTKDRFSKLAGLIKQAVQFLLKTSITVIIGLNVMKSILIPVYDNAKYNMFQKGLSAIPGGSSLSGISTILLGAGVLIKNSMGITVVIVLLVLGSVPLIKMLCFYVVYRVILALVQPVSDSRILAGIQGAADSTGILLRAASTSIVLSILSIAIVIMTTNVRLYAG